MQIYLNRPYRKKQEIFPYCLIIELKWSENREKSYRRGNGKRNKRRDDLGGGKIGLKKAKKQLYKGEERSQIISKRAQNKPKNGRNKGKFCVWLIDF